jgi:hypothetical protein
MGREFKKTFLRLSALPAVLLLVSPLGSGGAIGILSSIAKDYGVSANQVAWTNGLMGGVLTLAGAIGMSHDAGALRHSDGVRGHGAGECGGVRYSPSMRRWMEGLGRLRRHTPSRPRTCGDLPWPPRIFPASR